MSAPEKSKYMLMVIKLTCLVILFTVGEINLPVITVHPQTLLTCLDSKLPSFYNTVQNILSSHNFYSAQHPLIKETSA